MIANAAKASVQIANSVCFNVFNNLADYFALDFYMFLHFLMYIATGAVKRVQKVHFSGDSYVLIKTSIENCT